MKWSLVAIDERNEPIENCPLQESGEAQLVVSLTRTNSAPTANVSICNFPKVKEAGWFIVVANPDTKEVICLKRVSFKRHISKTLIVVLPDDFKNTPLQVLLMSDSYIGIDQTYTIDLNKVNQKIASLKTTSKEAKKEVEGLVQYKPANCDPENDSDDGFCRYSKLYQMSVHTLDDQASASDDESFEFDLQAEDIYDLTVF